MTRKAWWCALLALAVAGAADAGNGWQQEHVQGSVHFVLVPKAQARTMDVYRDAAASLCAGQRICIVNFWIDARKVPHALPMTDAQVAAQVASWNGNLNTGNREWLWNCKVVRHPEEGACGL